MKITDDTRDGIYYSFFFSENWKKIISAINWQARLLHKITTTITTTAMERRDEKKTLNFAFTSLLYESSVTEWMSTKKKQSNLKRSTSSLTHTPKRNEQPLNTHTFIRKTKRFFLALSSLLVLVLLFIRLVQVLDEWVWMRNRDKLRPTALFLFHI